MSRNKRPFLDTSCWLQVLQPPSAITSVNYPLCNNMFRSRVTQNKEDIEVKRVGAGKTVVKNKPKSTSP